MERHGTLTPEFAGSIPAILVGLLEIDFHMNVLLTRINGMLIKGPSQGPMRLAVKTASFYLS